MEITFFLTMRLSTSDDNSFVFKSLVVVILNTSDKKPVVLRKMTLISKSVNGNFPLTGDINTACATFLSHSLSRHGMATLKLLLVPVALLLTSKYKHCQPSLLPPSLLYCLIFSFLRDLISGGDLMPVIRTFSCIIEFNARH